MNKMKILTISAFIIVFIVSSSCNNNFSKKKHHQNFDKKTEYLMQSVLWYQRSGEMRALYFQGYNIAKYSLDNYLEKDKSQKKKAVIVDIDETILNNSPYEGRIILGDSSYSNLNWDDWINQSNADTLPGALSFLNYAKSRGVEVFYISNRLSSQIEPTLKNLKKFDFPFADENHLLFLSDKNSSKDLRRKKVAADYDIALLCGDNLGDLSSAFEIREENQLNDSINKYSADFGQRFIILPNPMYGDWQKIIYGKSRLIGSQRDSARRANLISY